MRFLIASGPTREPLDPVRYLSNYSTGAMGRCLEKAARVRGHKVDHVRCPEDAETARELLAGLKKKLPKNDVLIMAAAVCDSRPGKVSKNKIKKGKLGSIPLVQNPDILVELSKCRRKEQVFIGFALESCNVLKNGHKKLIDKGLQAILIQEITMKKTPFGDKSIDAFLLDRRGCLTTLKNVSKKKIAGILVRKAEYIFKMTE